MAHVVWERDLEQMIHWHNTRIGGLTRQLEQHRRNAEKAIAGMNEIKEQLDQAREGFEATVATHFEHRDDPEVLVRNYNETTIEVYHAGTWCGWVNSARSRPILLSRARMLGYRPCISCGYTIKEPTAA